ncbi:MAG: Bro-N domain-containing protein [bacterium]
MEISKIVIFNGGRVRRVIHNKEWYFSIVDIVAVLTDSTRASAYWSAMKTRVKNDEGIQLSTICSQLNLESSDGKKYETDCANTEGVFRIIQSIPSPKAEPFKRWLAKVGYERVKEIEDPELGVKRTRELYKLKGYSENWIEKRMHGITIREELTEEWKSRGARDCLDYEILTAEISKATFGVTPSEYKKLKGLKKESLRDNMNDFELIFNMLGERSTTEIHRNEDSKGISKLKEDAKFGGDIAGDARKRLEIKLKRSIVTRRRFVKGI